jgi:hypothetical protein
MTGRGTVLPWRLSLGGNSKRMVLYNKKAASLGGSFVGNSVLAS